MKNKTIRSITTTTLFNIGCGAMAQKLDPVSSRSSKADATAHALPTNWPSEPVDPHLNF